MAAWLREAHSGRLGHERGTPGADLPPLLAWLEERVGRCGGDPSRTMDEPRLLHRRAEATFASNALAGGVTVFELARVMGTSVRMIERHYGALLDGAHAGIAGRLDALEAQLEQGVA
jgi:hypothetical protein